MFHHVRVIEEDRSALRFLWQTKYDKPINDFKMNVYLFGKVVSSCCVKFEIKYISENQKEIMRLFPGQLMKNILWMILLS